jgi:hypothetical protein
MNDYPGVHELLEAVAELENVAKTHFKTKRAAMRDSVNSSPLALPRHLHAVPTPPKGKARAPRR